ncbi:MAG: hypothetical protein DIU69_07420 [Bacillota bacterium]|nr:MAG: hypothetical protein DIU69_07420 [Bacillota bacterium]
MSLTTTRVGKGRARGQDTEQPTSANPQGRERWPWLPFVDLSLAAALVPGFFLGGLLATAARNGSPWLAAYPALAQAHGHAQLAGWGGAMILGVALQFLPRLRGSQLARPGWVRPLFGVFAGGLALRVAGQVLAALVLATADPAAGSARTAAAAETVGHGLSLVAVVGVAAFALGAVLEAAAGTGLVLLLGLSLRSGPPLTTKKAFAQVAPLLAIAFASFVTALIAWAAGAVATALAVATAGAASGAVGAATGGRLPVIPPAFDRLAVEIALFGFIVGISLAMSARVFSLFFRVRPANPQLVRWTGLLLGTGILAGTVAGAVHAATGVRPPVLAGAADLLWGAALWTGTAAVHVFSRRLAFPGDRGRYAWWRDPAGAGAVAAYGWATLAGLILVLRGLWEWGIPVGPASASVDAAIHATGAGFMTLLILAVAPTMLPGFGGGRLRGPAWVWASVVLGCLAATLRSAPAIAPMLGMSAAGWGAGAMALGGVTGLLAVGALTVALRRSWRGRP